MAQGSDLTIAPGEPAPPTDLRVTAVLEVLAGGSVAEVAHRHAVDTAVLHRWVRGFVDAGTATVTNRPDSRAAQERDRFLAAFAHELRTPLAVAQGWVAMLQDEDLPTGLDRTVTRLEDALVRLAERTYDVELLAAASLGLLRPSPGRVRVAELVREIDVDAASVGLDHEVVVDRSLFSRVLRDLWEAGKAVPTPRSLTFEALPVGPWLEMRVVRAADPIEPRVLQALFEPFDLNDDATGVTIGLYLARALTVAHGGTLGVEQDDAGAVLWVRVPALLPYVAPPPPDRPAPRPDRPPM